MPGSTLSLTPSRTLLSRALASPFPVLFSLSPAGYPKASIKSELLTPPCWISGIAIQMSMYKWRCPSCPSWPWDQGLVCCIRALEGKGGNKDCRHIASSSVTKQCLLFSILGTAWSQASGPGTTGRRVPESANPANTDYTPLTVGEGESKKL